MGSMIINIDSVRTAAEFLISTAREDSHRHRWVEWEIEDTDIRFDPNAWASIGMPVTDELVDEAIRFVEQAWFSFASRRAITRVIKETDAVLASDSHEAELMYSRLLNAPAPDPRYRRVV